MSGAPTFSTSKPNPDDATVAKTEKHAAWDDEEEKEAGAVELGAPAAASPSAEPDEGGPQQGAAAAVAAGGSMAVDDLITRGIKPATLRAITLYVCLLVLWHW